jgi:hypothetical protein
MERGIEGDIFGGIDGKIDGRMEGGIYQRKEGKRWRHNGR